MYKSIITFHLAHKLNKYAFYIDWHNHTVEDIDRLHRALNEIVCSIHYSYTYFHRTSPFQANLRTMYRQKPVRLKLFTRIIDDTIINNLNILSVQPGTAIYNKSLECVCIRCKVTETNCSY